METQQPPTVDEEQLRAAKIQSIVAQFIAAGADIGEPNESIQVGASFVKKRDELGLILDPLSYAKKNCPACDGKGVRVVVQPVPTAYVMQQIALNPANEANFERKEKMKGKKKDRKLHVSYSLRAQEKCGCAKAKYDGFRSTMIRVMKAAGVLPEIVGVPIAGWRPEGDGRE